MRSSRPPGSISVAQAILMLLEAEGVEYVFGVPGGPLTAVFEAMAERGKIRLVLAKHEAGAAFMAASHARVGRRLGVCIATSGPGATNALTGIASAYADQLPVLMLTGQVATNVFGMGAIQESSVHGVDVVTLFRPVTKLSAMLPSVRRAPEIVRNAIRLALTGRPGPVHINLPADLLTRPVSPPVLPLGGRPSQGGARARPVDRDAIDRAAQVLTTAQTPCILAGHGAALSDATEPLVKLARALQAPVATSPKGKGVFPEDDPLSLGVLGFGGHDLAERYVETAGVDALLVVGCSMNEFVTNAWTLRFDPRTVFVQVDVDPAAIGRNYRAPVGVVGDARASLEELLTRLGRVSSPSLGVRASRLHELRQTTPRVLAAEAVDSDAAPMKPQRLVKELRAGMPDDAMLFVDTGTSIIWAGHYFEARRPNTYFLDLGLAAMGSAIAGMVGGALADRSRRAVALVGDAAFTMTGFEVHTAVEERLPIVWVVLNNGGHGMVHQGDVLMKGRDLGVALFRVPIDAAATARSLGARGVRVSAPAEFRDALRDALRANEPTVIDAVVDAEEPVPTLIRRVKSLATYFAGRRDDAP